MTLEAWIAAQGTPAVSIGSLVLYSDPAGKVALPLRPDGYTETKQLTRDSRVSVERVSILQPASRATGKATAIGTAATAGGAVATGGLIAASVPLAFTVIGLPFAILGMAAASVTGMATAGAAIGTATTAGVALTEDKLVSVDVVKLVITGQWSYTVTMPAEYAAGLDHFARDAQGIISRL